MKERVVFEINVPVTAALAYADGLKVEGRYGDQVMYSLSDERVMYVPPAVRDQLIELGIRQREPFSICKVERREGSRRFIQWVVKRLPSESSELTRDQPLPGAAPSGTAATGIGTQGNGKPNGTVPGTPNGSTAGQAPLRAALVASIDAALEAERYAAERGRSIRFGSEDLRAMALSLFIQHARDGGVR
jgi:hypothetical protein